MILKPMQTTKIVFYTFTLKLFEGNYFYNTEYTSGLYQQKCSGVEEREKVLKHIYLYRISLLVKYLTL